MAEPKRFDRLPSYPQRAVPWELRHLVPALRYAHVTGRVKPRVEFAGMFGARPVLGWSNTVPGARLSLPFAVGEAGRYAVRLTGVAGPEYGLYDIELDEQTASAKTDFRAPDYDELDLSLGTRELRAGSHTVSFRALPVAEKKARPLAVEMLRLLRLPPEAVRPVKTENEAHFIRLGLGRAIYAYRPANGALPESLDVLVQAGLMPARFLADENNQPLTLTRHGSQSR